MNVLLIRKETGAQFSPHLGLGYLAASLKQERVMLIFLTSKWYNRLFHRNATNIKFINSFTRKIYNN